VTFVIRMNDDSVLPSGATEIVIIRRDNGADPSNLDG
jgi:hypothetical protein